MVDDCNFHISQILANIHECLEKKLGELGEFSFGISDLWNVLLGEVSFGISWVS